MSLPCSQLWKAHSVPYASDKSSGLCTRRRFAPSGSLARATQRASKLRLGLEPPDGHVGRLCFAGSLSGGSPAARPSRICGAFASRRATKLRLGLAPMSTAQAAWSSPTR